MHVKQVLIVSDDAHTRAWLSQALDKLEVRIAESPASDYRARLLAESWDLLVIEAGRDPVAAASGLEQAVAAGEALRVLVIAERDILHRLTLPISVPSDFLVRGASSEELAVRARTLLWPGEDASDQELFRVDDLTINLATYQAHISGRPVDFAYLEYALFSFLVTHPGRTYSREALLKRVWGTDYYGGPRTVDVHVRRIRAKIGLELSRRLKTVRNVGYLWER